MPSQSRTSDKPFVIEGHQAADGTFWPHMELEVKTEPEGKWIKVVSTLDQTVSAKVTIYYDMAVHGMRVSLEPLRQYIGKYKLARVRLQSGAEAVFNLADLKPPRN